MASDDNKDSATNGDSIHLVSGEELAQAKSDLEGSDDEAGFSDAAGEQEAVADADGNFEVTAEEVNAIKTELASAFPEDYASFRCVHLHSTPWSWLLATAESGHTINTTRPMDIELGLTSLPVADEFGISIRCCGQ
jgi:hypothetical protein